MRKAERWEMPEAIRRRVKISEARFYRWKHWDGTMKLIEVEELKTPRDENTLLKRLAADQALNIQVLKEVTQK